MCQALLDVFLLNFIRIYKNVIELKFTIKSFMKNLQKCTLIF